MKLKTYRDQVASGQIEKDTAKSIRANAIYLGTEKKNLNIYLTAPEAIKLAERVLEQVRVIVVNDIEGAAVQIYSKNGKSLSCGIENAVASKMKKRKT